MGKGGIVKVMDLEIWGLVRDGQRRWMLEVVEIGDDTTMGIIVIGRNRHLYIRTIFGYIGTVRSRDSQPGRR